MNTVEQVLNGANHFETGLKNGQPEITAVETGTEMGITIPRIPLDGIEAARRIVENVGNLPEIPDNQPPSEISMGKELKLN